MRGVEEPVDAGERPRPVASVTTGRQLDRGAFVLKALEAGVSEHVEPAVAEVDREVRVARSSEVVGGAALSVRVMVAAR